MVGLKQFKQSDKALYKLHLTNILKDKTFWPSPYYIWVRYENLHNFVCKELHPFL